MSLLLIIFNENRGVIMLNVEQDKLMDKIIFLLFSSIIFLEPFRRIINMFYGTNISIGKILTMLIAIYLTIKLLRKDISISRNYDKFLLSFVILVYIWVFQVISFDYVITYEFKMIKQEYIGFIIRMMMNTLIYYIIGKNILSIYRIIKQQQFKKITLILYCMWIVFLVIVKLNSNKVEPGHSMFEGLAIDKSLQGNYLLIGDCFALYSFWVDKFLNNKFLKIGLFANCVYWLYTIGSRTSFYVFLLVGLIYYTINLFKIKKQNQLYISVIKILSIILIISLVGVNYNAIFNSDSDKDKDNRMLSLLTDKEEDISYNGRKMHLELGVEDINVNPIWGKFMVEYSRSTRAGGYIHNIMSYWQEYGIIPFFCLLILVIIYLLKSIYYLIKSDDKFMIYLCETTIFITITALFSRSYIYFFIWFVLFSWGKLERDFSKLKNINLVSNIGTSLQKSA